MHSYAARFEGAWYLQLADLLLVLLLGVLQLLITTEACPTGAPAGEQPAEGTMHLYAWLQ